MNHKRLVIFSLSSLLIFLAGVLVWQFIQQGKSYFDTRLKLTQPQEYQVLSGDGVTTTIERFVAMALLPPPPLPYLLRLQLKQQGLNFGIQRGAFLLQPGISLRTALELLRSGQIIQRRWVLIEGQTLVQAMEQLQQHEYIDYDLPAVNSFADYPALSQALGLTEHNPEGMFLADTYFFSDNTKASSILTRAREELAAIQQKVTPACANLEQAGLTSLAPYQRAILASIIEKETSLASERSKISAILHNRLARGMRLQTDPTVIYGLGTAYSGNITKKHLTDPTPYNTYTIKGLPPTPISSFGTASLLAVCNPDTDFVQRQMLYFVGKGDGSHHFSATYSEHQKAVTRYQLLRVKDYRSSRTHE